MSHKKDEWSTTKSYQLKDRKASPAILVASLAVITGAGIITYSCLAPKEENENKKAQGTASSTTSSSSYHPGGGGFTFWHFGSGSSTTPSPSRFAGTSSKVSYSAPAHSPTVSRGFFGGIGGGHFSSFGG